MNIKEEIEKFSSEEDKPVLFWLLHYYRWRSKWDFVADSKFERYGFMSYEVNKVWFPSIEGRILYENRERLPLYLAGWKKLDDLSIRGESDFRSIADARYFLCNKLDSMRNEDAENIRQARKIVITFVGTDRVDVNGYAFWIEKVR